MLTCDECGRVLAVSEGEMTSQGLLCDRCAQAAEDEDEPYDDEYGDEPYPDYGREGPWLDDWTGA